MANYIIDENYDTSKLKQSELERNVFSINALADGFEVKKGGKIDVNLIYRRNEMQDSIVTSRSFVTIKRQIDSKFGNKSNTRKLIAVPIKPKEEAKTIKPKLEEDVRTNDGGDSSTKVSTKTRRKPRKNK